MTEEKVVMTNGEAKFMETIVELSAGSKIFSLYHTARDEKNEDRLQIFLYPEIVFEDLLPSENVKPEDIAFVVNAPKGISFAKTEEITRLAYAAFSQIVIAYIYGRRKVVYDRSREAVKVQSEDKVPEATDENQEPPRS